MHKVNQEPQCSKIKFLPMKYNSYLVNFHVFWDIDRLDEEA